ncbi:MAG: hypothetical protein WCJ84_03655 [Candidatus Peregrinibacteria bacterium]
MKNPLFLAVPVFSLLLLFSGCSTPVPNGESPQSSSSAESFSFTRPQTPPNVSGTLKSLVGNEATISTRDMANIPDDVKKLIESTTGRAMPSGGFTGGMPGGAGGGFGGGRGPGGMAGGPQMSDTDRQKMRDAMAKIPTKETKVLIPVGIPMAKQSRSADGKESFTEASLADLKVGGNITLWTTEQNGKTIANTAIVRSRSQSSSPAAS